MSESVGVGGEVGLFRRNRLVPVRKVVSLSGLNPASRRSRHGRAGLPVVDANATGHDPPAPRDLLGDRLDGHPSVRINGLYTAR
jgi:hypothetical protein